MSKKIKMTKWYSVFEDATGGFSMMRVCLAFVVLIVMLGWGVISFKKKELTPIPAGIVTLVATLAGAKVVQRFGEKDETSIIPSNSDGNNPITIPMTLTVQGIANANGQVNIKNNC